MLLDSEVAAPPAGGRLAMVVRMMLATLWLVWAAAAGRSRAPAGRSRAPAGERRAVA